MSSPSVGTIRPVQVGRVAAVKAWRLALRGPGPAGAVRVELPGLILHADRAQPHLALDLAVIPDLSGALPPGAVELAGLLFGAEAAQLLDHRREGVAGYTPVMSSRREALMRWAAVSATLAERPALAGLDAAAAAATAAGGDAHVGPIDALHAGAVELAQRAAPVAALIRAGGHLGLDPGGQDLLEQMVAVARDLLGTDSWAGPAGSGADWDAELRLLSRQLDEDAELRRLLPTTLTASPGGGFRAFGGLHPGGGQPTAEAIGVDGMPVAGAVAEPVTMARTGTGWQVTGRLDYRWPPPLWARAVTGDGTIIQQRRCQCGDRGFSVALPIGSGRADQEALYLELTIDPLRPGRGPGGRAVDVATAIGADAARRADTVGDGNEAEVAASWRNCARAWQHAATANPDRPDFNSQAWLAYLLAARWYQRAGRGEDAAACRERLADLPDESAAMWHLQAAGSPPIGQPGLGNIEPVSRGLASIALGSGIDSWVVATLDELTETGLSDDETRLPRLERVTALGDPRSDTVRRARAAARVAEGERAAARGDLALADDLLTSAYPDFADMTDRQRQLAHTLQDELLDSLTDL